MTGTLRIIPLGGLGEIGMNCLVLEQDGRRVMVDCGVTFDDGDYGIDTIHPRFELVSSAPDSLEGILLTHGHEDHIGAVAALVGELRRRGRTRPLPLWGPSYALALCHRRLEEAHLTSAVVETRVEPGAAFEAGPFGVEALTVTHSIPAATSLVIETAAGRVVHSGDFKLDERPLDGRLTDLARLRELGDEGIALLLSDSTNVLVPGSARSEGVVADELARLIAAAPARVVVGLFASNMQRIDAVAQAALATGRRLCLLGRSVTTHVAVAEAHGVVRWPSDLKVSPEGARSLPRDGVVYVASGTQGETRGAMRRIAGGTHHQVSLQLGDEVLLSSRIIPGNERIVFGMVDALLARGVAVKSRVTHPEIHASGHAHRDELRRFLSATRPQAFIPLHGTRLHLAHHAALARELGVEVVMTLHNGETACLRDGQLLAAEAVPVGRVATSYGATLDDEVIRQRRQLGRAGLVVVALAVSDGAASDVAVEVVTRGVPQAEAIESCARRVAAATYRRAASAAPARDGLEPTEAIRRAVRGGIAELLGYKPLVEVKILPRR